MLQISIVLGDVFYIFFSFRNLLKHVMCQIIHDDLTNLIVHMQDKIFYHPWRKRNGEIAVNSKVLGTRKLISEVKNALTKVTPCTRIDL